MADDITFCYSHLRYCEAPVEIPHQLFTQQYKNIFVCKSTVAIGNDVKQQ